MCHRTAVSHWQDSRYHTLVWTDMKLQFNWKVGKGVVTKEEKIMK